VASPRGISALIHSFVWKWATEWVFFVIEVVGVYMIIYLVGKVDRATHLRISIIFGLTSYGTMLVIIGILSFMMWPGQPRMVRRGRLPQRLLRRQHLRAAGDAHRLHVHHDGGGRRHRRRRFKDAAFKGEITRKLAGWAWSAPRRRA
jgi:hypothetical protein